MGEEPNAALEKLVCGTWALGGAYGTPAMLSIRETYRVAHEAGIRRFDASPLWGESEATLGELFQGEIKLHTRCGVRVEDGALVRDYSSDALRRELETSLKNAQVDKLASWSLHAPAEAELNDETVETMIAAVEEGMVERWGVASQSPDVLRRAIHKGAQTVTLPFNSLWTECLDAVHEAKEQRRQAGEEESAEVLARSILMHGLLTERWTAFKQFGPGDHRQARWTARALRIRLQELREAQSARDGQSTGIQEAIHFATSNRRISACIIGPRRPEQLHEVLDKIAGQSS